MACRKLAACYPSGPPRTRFDFLDPLKTGSQNRPFVQRTQRPSAGLHHGSDGHPIPHAHDRSRATRSSPHGRRKKRQLLAFSLWKCANTAPPGDPGRGRISTSWAFREQAMGQAYGVSPTRWWQWERYLKHLRPDNCDWVADGQPGRAEDLVRTAIAPIVTHPRRDRRGRAAHLVPIPCCTHPGGMGNGGDTHGVGADDRGRRLPGTGGQKGWRFSGSVDMGRRPDPMRRPPVRFVTAHKIAVTLVSTAARGRTGRGCCKLRGP